MSVDTKLDVTSKQYKVLCRYNKDTNLMVVWQPEIYFSITTFGSSANHL